MDLKKDEKRFPYTCGRCSAPSTTMRPLQRCGGCQLVAYCSKDCQKEDRRLHKSLCKEFPVVNGINALHTKRPWKEHLATLRRRGALLPYEAGSVDRALRDPKVCNICQESRPSLLTMCKCNMVAYCSEMCTRADESHKDICSNLYKVAQIHYCMSMRRAYPMTVVSALEEIYSRNQGQCDYHCTEDIGKLKIHIVTNRTYFDPKAWEILFHQESLLNLKQLDLVFIMNGSGFELPLPFKSAYNQDDCDVCSRPKQKAKKHTINFSKHMKPYHMFFSSSEYSEPDMVIVYGVTNISNDIHSEISYRNMTYSKKSILVLTDSTFDRVVKGNMTTNAARPMDAITLPIKNHRRFFGTHLFGMKFDPTADNEKNYLVCLKRE